MKSGTTNGKKGTLVRPVILLSMIAIFGFHLAPSSCAARNVDFPLDIPSTETVQNGGFETGDLMGWETSEDEGTCRVVDTERFSGSYSARLHLDKFCSQAQLQQRIHVGGSVVLSLNYKIAKTARPCTFSILLQSDSGLFGQMWTNKLALHSEAAEEGDWQSRKWTLDYLAGHDVDVVLSVSSWGACQEVADLDVYVDDVSLQEVLEPVPSGIKNGGFEEGTLDDWAVTQSFGGAAQVTSSEAHTGTHSAKLHLNEFCSHARISQALRIGGYAVLSLNYRVAKTARNCRIEVSLRDYSTPVGPWGMDSILLLREGAEEGQWKKHSWTLDCLTGRLVELVIAVESSGACQEIADIDVYVDDVSLIEVSEPIPSGLKNGGFEKGALDDWGITESLRGEVEVTSTDVHSGDYSAELHLPYHCDGVRLAQRLILPEGALLSFSMRSPATHPRALLEVDVFDYTNLCEEFGWTQPTQMNLLSESLKADEWTTAEFDLSALVGHYVELAFSFSADGTCPESLGAYLYLDDVRIPGDSYGTEMNIRLEKGLNLISIPLLLENRNVAAVLAPIIDKVVLVATFDRGAKTYEPVLPEFSDLKEIDHKHGYWIKVSEETSLPLNGRKLTEAEKRIEISQSWNLVSYLCEEARPTSIFFWSRGDILIVEGFDRLRQEKTRYYAPSNTGNLTQLLPLRGYWMKASGSFTLDYGDLCQRSFIEVFVDSFHLPKVQGIDTILDVPEHDVEVFKVTYGDPMDCPSGCIYSEAIGLQHKNKIGWLKTGGWSSAYQYMYEFDSGDVYLLSADFLSRLESADIWLYRSYISWVAKEPYTPDDVLLDLAQSLPSYIHSFLAQSLLENPKVQTNVEILTIIANLPYFQGDPYGEVRAEARRLLDRLASEGNSISARESAAHGGGYSDTASSLSTMSSNEMTMARFYEPPMLTTEWVDFYGTCDLDVGDEIAYYANGILSGWCEITVSGKYLCHVYGDDPTNEEMVGAAKGDLLTATVFDVSERREYVSNLIGDASWTEFLDRKKVDVEKAAPVPEFKASLVLDGDQEAYTLSWPERGTTGTYDVLYADDLCGEWKVAVEGLRQSSWADDGTETGGLSRNRFYRIAAY